MVSVPAVRATKLGGVLLEAFFNRIFLEMLVQAVAIPQLSKEGV